MRLLKLKGGALQLVVFIMVIVALFLSGFLLFLHTKDIVKIHQNDIKVSIENSKTGIQYALMNTLQLHDTIDLKDSSIYQQSIKLHKEYWGIFQKVISKSTINNSSVTKIALISGELPLNNRPNLFLKDKNEPLVLVGNSKLQGEVYISSKGIRTGNIAGQSYYGSESDFGNLNVINKYPNLSTELLNEIEFIYNKDDTIESNHFIYLNRDSTYVNSFLKPLKLYYDRDAIELSDVSIKGNILIKSEKNISIHKSTLLQDVLLVAPIISIQDSVQGNFQAFASKSIKVGSYTHLNYPSSLVVNSNKKNKPKITIDSDCEIDGIIMCLSDSDNSDSQIEIQENSLVKGEVFSEANLELRGTVYGCVYADKFIVKENGLIYQNHLYNGQILIDSLPNEFGGILFENSNKTIAQWLY